ncbi:uncharacterized protein I206_100028 [Kwoniella pini CBS 10737]|uniref:Uncharacterized protein n=1 Tax=Kwoniella pini CBS 10737 TaxID=1296096 RepID=A0A1B9HSB8_9TREE|nr:uncharacterized protein I206_07843 [Kwoniella pini CBS 10737]OCF46173.1 hypothetical protein I206_07843 [Kwoniella pini CBS 10737]
MRFFTSCESQSSIPMTDRSRLENVQDEPDQNQRGSNGWKEFEKESKDFDGNWKGKVWIKEWSNVNQEQEQDQDKDKDRNIITNTNRSDSFIFTKLKNRNSVKPEGVSEQPMMNEEKGNVQEGEIPLEHGRLQSRNMVILDTILRSSYKAGYNDALKIKPFLPYSTSNSPFLIPDGAQSTIHVDTDNASQSYILLLGLGGLALAGIGSIMYASLNRLKNVERGLQEILALVQLREKNELASIGRLSKEFVGLRRFIEENHNAISSSTSIGQSDTLTLTSNSAQQVKTLKAETEDIRSMIDEMNINLKKEFRMIAKDSNGNQIDLNGIKQNLEKVLEIQNVSNSKDDKSSSTVSGGKMNNSIPNKVIEEIQKISSETYHLRENLNGLIKIGKELQGEISLNNQLVKNNLNKSEDLKKALEIFKNDSSSSSSIHKFTTPTIASQSSSVSFMKSAQINQLSRNLNHNLRKDDHDVMPLSDIQKQIEAVKKSYLKDQDKSLVSSIPNASTSVDRPKVADEIGQSEDLAKQVNSPRERGQHGPMEGVQFTTPIEKVKNPYKVSSSPPTIPDVVRKDPIKEIPTSSSEKQDEDDDGSTPPSPPPPSSSSGLTSRTPAPYSSGPSSNSSTITTTARSNRTMSKGNGRLATTHGNGNGHWWAVHSFSLPHIRIDDAWRVKGFGWYHPHDAIGRQPVQIQNQSQKSKKDKVDEEDRSLGAWAIDRVKRKFGDWPFH